MCSTRLENFPIFYERRIQIATLGKEERWEPEGPGVGAGRMLGSLAGDPRGAGVAPRFGVARRLQDFEPAREKLHALGQVVDPGPQRLARLVGRALQQEKHSW